MRRKKAIRDLLWSVLFFALAGIVLFMTPVAVKAQCGPSGCPGKQQQCGPNGCPSERQPMQRFDVRIRGKEKAKEPHPAWRYEKPEKHRAAIVRIYCREDARIGSIGSGTLVRWNGRIVVLTARHVVVDAQKIIVELCTKKTYWARVLRVDAVWDCAVLELAGKPEGVEPVAVELGEAAMPSEGTRLESCGYGPPLCGRNGCDGEFVTPKKGERFYPYCKKCGQPQDSRFATFALACNSGLFLGYRRPAEGGDGRDDWMVISGHARQGDSGGGVFNERGHLVGVLWGTDGESVVCVQAGRIHVLLDEAVPYAQRSYDPCRNPTRPKEPADPQPVDICDLPAVEVAVQNDSLLPWRNKMEQQAREQAEKLERISGQLDGIASRQQAQPPVVTPPPPVAPPQAKKDESEGGPRTALGRMRQKEADWLAEHGGPISSRIAASASEKLDSDSPGVRFVGFTQVGVAIGFAVGALVLFIGLGVLLIHRANNKLLPILQQKAAATANTYDDAAVAKLMALHDKVDVLGEKIKSKLPISAAPTETTTATA